jgi:hypothetical protein
LRKVENINAFWLLRYRPYQTTSTIVKYLAHANLTRAALVTLCIYIQNLVCRRVCGSSAISILGLGRGRWLTPSGRTAHRWHAVACRRRMLAWTRRCTALTGLRWRGPVNGRRRTTPPPPPRSARPRQTRTPQPGAGPRAGRRAGGAEARRAGGVWLWGGGGGAVPVVF